MAKPLLLSASVEVLLQKIISLTTENINLVFGSPDNSSSLMKNWFSQKTNVVQAVRKALEKLRGSLSNIQAVSRENLRQQDKAEVIRLWLQKLEDLAYDADNALAEFSYEILQHEVEILNKEKPKVRLFSSHSDEKSFRQEMMPKARDINNKLEMINKEVKDFLVSEKFLVTTASPPQLDVVQEVDFLIADLKITENEEKISPEICWSIIKEKAGASKGIPVGLEDIGRQIAEKCQGLSLVANLLGGLLQNKGRDFWSSVLESGLLDKEDIISKILKLYFDNLPSPFVKRCFAFCSIFPRDSVIERDQLVQLWMAEGFIDLEMGISVMEELGNQYFDTLLQNSLLEIVSKDNFNKVTHCKMHNLVHDFASSLSKLKGITFGESEQDDIPQIQHLVLESFTEEAMKIAKEKARYLRTLFLKSNLPDNNLLNLNFLYVLNLCDADIEELPASVGELRHLQYLDLSRTTIMSIPDSAGNLYKLQTLRILECKWLYELPETFKNLLSLRHLHFHVSTDKFFEMPYEFGRLTNLRTLPIYNVGGTQGDRIGPRIGELKYLKRLRGKLEMRNLELVKDKKDSEQAHLSGKPNLQEVDLRWTDLDGRPNNDENVLEGLEPHPNLKSLSIEYFMGDRFPSRVMKMSVKGGSLRPSSLVEVKLERCERCKEIPTLGLLLLLQNLEIVDLFQVSCFGSSFYSDNGSNTSTSQVTETFFPALKSLTIDNMPRLVDWKGPEEISAAYEAKAFPSLERLFLTWCFLHGVCG